MSATSETLQTYAIDAAHSTAEFVVRHLVISKVRGRFGKVAGTIHVPDGSEVPTDVTAEIDATTIDTREEQRDGHLKSADFLHVDQHPTITFKSTNIAGSGSSFTIVGDLTIRGVTKSVELDAQFDGRGKDPWGGSRIAFSAETKINRKDFGLNWNQALETGGVMVSDEVRIELNVQAVLQA
ncbi:polyisoprenoid-binding protein [Vulcanimicrobium alpinum]|uniref:Polyisoprenoid-binding protein n=1 Tax=Vulcanimicrobium alpinum TaxID=3016050 RepID=A0AAN2C919_UNVUL|nr:YceI family protein [Vulcanimicrobium alpinum]BDE05561.1 polyisoprenoid-binding protein [Vulcanimicrobium alpinum]